jgi:predicted ester cyclase
MKKSFVLLPIFLFLFFSCQDKDTLAELNALKDIASLEEQNQALVETYIGIWNSRDFDMLDEVLDPQVMIYVPSTSNEPMSLETNREWINGIVQGFPDIQYEIRDIFAAGDKVCVWWVCDATLPGVDPDSQDAGKKIAVGAIEIYTVKDGKITEERCEVDGEGWNQQLGYTLVPPDMD